MVWGRGTEHTESNSTDKGSTEMKKIVLKCFFILILLTFWSSDNFFACEKLLFLSHDIVINAFLLEALIALLFRAKCMLIKSVSKHCQMLPREGINPTESQWFNC